MRLKSALLPARTTVLLFTKRFNSSNMYTELPLTLMPRPG